MPSPKPSSSKSSAKSVALPGGGAALPPAGSEQHLYLIDLSGYVFRAYHAIAPLSSSKGEPTHAVMGTVNMLQKVVTGRRPHLFAVAMDSKGKTFRHELDVRYKAQRPEAPPDLAQQMARCEAIVRAYNIPVYQVDGMEADDLIASVTKRAVAAGLSVVIVSSDKDLMQLVRDDDERVILWDSMRDKVYGPREVEEKWGVKPSRLHDLLALVGDTSDNIPGVPGVGPKTAADLLKAYDTLEGVYANLGSLTKAKLKESLLVHEADARLSYQLVALRDDIDIAWDLTHLTYGEPDVPELQRLFTELEFSRLLDQVKPPVMVKREYVTVTTRDALDAIVAAAHASKTLAIDLELTRPEPMQAGIVGVALSTGAGLGAYVPISHRYLGAPSQLAWPEVKAALSPLFADVGVTKIGHDLKGIELVLLQHGARLEGPRFDTMLAGYLLDSEASTTLVDASQRELSTPLATFGLRAASAPKPKGPAQMFDELEIERATPFAAAKAETVAALALRTGPRLESDGLGSLFRDVEMPLAHVLLEMEHTGVLVDIRQLAIIGKRAEEELRTLEGRAKALAGRDFSVRSRDQLETILFDELELPVLKRTHKGGRSTDASVLEELAERHELPRVINEYREIDKLKGTYIDALPRVVDPKTGRIHTTYDQAVAATGRLSSRDPNLQNIPIRTALGREIRSAFVAPPGHVILSADYSQVELRLLAHLAGDAKLVESFRSGEDVHTRTAALIFEVPPEAVTKEMRNRAKTINFGVIYGMGDSALAKQIDVTREEAAQFIEAYFTRYEGVRTFMEQTVVKARQGEAVRTLLGRRRFLPNLHSANRGLRMEAERVAKNTPIQGTAADLMKLAMLKLGQDPVLPGVKLLLTVHDELVFEVPEALAKEAGEKIRLGMASAMTLDVPLVVDVGYGPNWSTAH
jgi:DNA polymerase-1